MPEDMEFVEDDVAADPPPLPEFNKDEALPNQIPVILRTDTGVHASLKTLSGHLQNLRNPDGSKMNPAKTCQDIKQCYPLKNSGECFLLYCSVLTHLLKTFCRLIFKWILFVILMQASTGLIQTKEAQKTPSRSSVIWKVVKLASLLIQPTFPANHGGLNPVPAPTNLCGSEST